MVGEDFLFNGNWLSRFTYKMYDPETSQSFVDREIERADMSALREIPNHYSTKYADVLVLNFLIIKDCELYDKNEMKLTKHEIDKMCSWLEGTDLPSELKILDDNSEPSLYFGVFTSVQPYILNHECYGLYLTFTCNAPYGFTEYVTRIYDIVDDNVSNIIFYNQSSEMNKYLKPIVKIHSSSSFDGTESIDIKNKTDNNNVMSVILPENLSVLIIDCAKKQITDQNGNLISMKDIGVTLPTSDAYNFISANVFVFYWLRFLHGENELTLTPKDNATIESIEICARYPRKYGGF